LQAWSKVESAIRHIGSYNSIAFDDPLIHWVILDMGGWVKLCACSAKEMPFCANEFMKRYQACREGKSSQHPKYLVGVIEHSNRSAGYTITGAQEPVLMGNPSLALAVFATGTDSPAIPINRPSEAGGLLKPLSLPQEISSNKTVEEAAD
jgi:hypothetical protein